MARRPAPADMTRLSIEETQRLITAALERLGVDDHALAVTCEHLLDAELRDHGGLERLFVLAETAERHGMPRGSEPVLTDETDTTVLVDGGGGLGFTAAALATKLAVAKAKGRGIALGRANNHRYSGVLGLYAERAAREGVVAIAVGTGTLPVVAPYGSREALLCTNPIAIGFPSTGDPIIWDTATSAVSGAVLAQRAEDGEPLPAGAAVDARGRPTTDAREAISGAVLAWGGHRGSGLAIAVQLLGLLCGLGAVDDGPGDWEAGFLMIAIDPSVLPAASGLRRGAAELAAGIRGSRPAQGHDAVRMPSDRSMAALRRRLSDGLVVATDDAARLRALAGDC